MSSIGAAACCCRSHPVPRPCFAGDVRQLALVEEGHQADWAASRGTDFCLLSCTRSWFLFSRKRFSSVYRLSPCRRHAVAAEGSDQSAPSGHIWKQITAEAEGLGLPTKFLQMVPTDLSALSLTIYRPSVAEYHPGEHRMVLNRTSRSTWQDEPCDLWLD